MKKILMAGLLALALAFMTVACNSPKAEELDSAVADTEMVETEADTNVAEVEVDTLQL